MDNPSIIRPIPPNADKSKREILPKIISALFALVLAYDTTILIAPTKGLADFAWPFIIMPVAWICYYRIFGFLVRKSPRIIYLFLVVSLINISYVYYFNFRHLSSYPSHMVIRDNLQTGDTGEEAHFGIVPENSGETYSNDIVVPITLHLPDKSSLQSTVTIFAFSTNCERGFLTAKCFAETRDFPLIDRFFALSQPGHYVLDSSDPNVKGVSFDVAPASNNKIQSINNTVSDFLPLPQVIGTFKKDPSWLVPDTLFDHVRIRETYETPSETTGSNKLTFVDILRYNLSESLTYTELLNFIKGVRSPYDIQDLKINDQKVVFAWVNVYGQKSSYFPEELGVPVVSWISNNKIVSITFNKDKNNKNFDLTNPLNADFIKAILQVYPSTYK